MAKSNQLLTLVELIWRHLNLEELDVLCFVLDIDELVGEPKITKIRYLVSHLERRERLDELVLYLRETRPDVDWPTFKEYQKSFFPPADLASEKPKKVRLQPTILTAIFTIIAAIVAIAGFLADGLQIYSRFIPTPQAPTSTQTPIITPTITLPATRRPTSTPKPSAIPTVTLHATISPLQTPAPVKLPLARNFSSLTIIAATITLLSTLVFGFTRIISYQQEPERFAQKLGDTLALTYTKVNLPHKWLRGFAFEVEPVFGNIKLSQQLPVVFCHRKPLTDDDLRDIKRILVTKLPESYNNVLVILNNDNSEQIEETKILLKRAGHTLACDFIPLTKEQIKQIITSPEPRSALRQFIMSQVDLITASPYVLSGPTPTEMFFGREQELREIADNVSQTSYALVGGRRMGKTSVLKRLERARLLAKDYHPLYLDCSITASEAEFIEALIYDKAWFKEPPNNRPNSFINLLPNGKPLVILLDEIDKIVLPDQQAGYPLLLTFRALANNGRCRFVFSGEQALRDELNNPDSPLFNFAEEYLIGRLDKQAVEELVTRPMKQLEIELIDEPALVQKVWDFTSGHPNIVQRLCQQIIIHLSQRQDRQLQTHDIETIITDPDFLRRDFLNVYWERATALERLCCLIMATNHHDWTLTTVHDAFVKKNIAVELNQVDKALERLVDLRNILRRTTEGYAFAVTAFPEVIGKTARLEELIALNLESFRQYGDVPPRMR